MNGSQPSKARVNLISNEWVRTMVPKQLYHTSVASIFVVGVALLVSSCMPENQTMIHVHDGNPPRFTFSKAERMGLLFVLRLHDAHSGVSLAQVKNNSPDTMWWIEGERRKDDPITYGDVPVDMREITPAKPLVEGEYYLVYGNSGAGGDFRGATFVIRNGEAQELKER